MHNTEIDIMEVDGQIDFHLRRIPKKSLPVHFDEGDFRQEIHLELLERKS